MLVCVDGSGPFRDAEYSAAMAGSFVRRIWSTSRLPGHRLYYRGPDAGGNLTNVARPATILQRDILPRIAGGDTDIYLCGYSRGAAIVINTAALLGDLGYEVQALFLFDAVDRSFEISRCDEIPPNVGVAYHALRDRRTGSRTSFGNCGTRTVSPALLHYRTFYTTHAGIGGTPWGKAGILDQSLAQTIEFAISTESQRRAMLAKYKIVEGFWGSETNVTPEQEEQGMQQVRAWMWGHLRNHGVVG